MQRPWRQAGWLWAAGAVWLGWVGPSRGEEPRLWLRWSAPPECQGTAEVERQLEALLDRELDFAALPDTGVALRWELGRWVVVVRLRQGAGWGQREFRTPSCAQAFDAVALTLALALDPELAAQQPAAVDSGLVGAAVAGESVRDGRGTGAAAPHASASLAPVEQDEAPTGEPGQSRWPSIRVGAGARVDLSSLPVALGGGGLQVSGDAGAWRLELGAEWLASGASQLPRAVYPVQYSLAFATAQGCYGFPFATAGRFAGCTGLQVGSLRGREVQGGELGGRALWLGAGAAAELGWQVVPLWHVFARGQLLFPLERHQLELRGVGIVHTVPAVTAQFQLGITIAVTDWLSG